MKKLAVYSALLVTLLALTACESKTTTTTTTTPPANQTQRDRTIPSQNPNQPTTPTTPADRDQIQR